MRPDCLLLLGLLLATPASALQQDVPFEEMRELATLVVVGEVTTLEPRWASGDEGFIETHVWLALEHVDKGEVGDSLELVVEGGRIGDVVTGNSDEPHLALDRRYLLLLVKDGAGRWRVLGGPRGAVPLAPVDDPADPLVVP